MWRWCFLFPFGLIKYAVFNSFVFPVLEFMHACHGNPDAPLGSEITVAFLRTLISWVVRNRCA
jgi:hypothetical protein